MLKVNLGYPTPEEEQRIVRANIQKTAFPSANRVIGSEEIKRAREVVKEVYLDEKIEKYIVDLVYSTRSPENYRLNNLKPLIGFGCSPRASINLALAAKAYAFINRRGYVIPEDVRELAQDVMRHRLGLTYEAEAENITKTEIINTILNKVEVP